MGSISVKFLLCAERANRVIDMVGVSLKPVEDDTGVVGK
jgi:hypothetical protein